MKKARFSHVLFSLAVIAALVVAAVPVGPAHAMSSTPSSSVTSIAATTADAPVMGPAGAVVCRSITVWRHGHRVTLRICHRVHRQAV